MKKCFLLITLFFSVFISAQLKSKIPLGIQGVRSPNKVTLGQQGVSIPSAIHRPFSSFQPQLSLIDSLVAGWKGGVLVDGVAPDVTGRGNDLTAIGSPTTVVGLPDSAWSLDGSYDLSKVGNNSILACNNTNFTISAWAKNTTSALYLSYQVEDNTLYLIWNDDGTWIGQPPYTNSDIWRLHIVTYNKNNHQFNWYVNDTLVQAWDGGIFTADTNGTFYIGHGDGLYGFTVMVGLIGDVNIWHDTLDANRRKLLYNSGLGMTFPFTPYYDTLEWRFRHENATDHITIINTGIDTSLWDSDYAMIGNDFQINTTITDTTLWRISLSDSINYYYGWFYSAPTYSARITKYTEGNIDVIVSMKKLVLRNEVDTAYNVYKAHLVSTDGVNITETILANTMGLTLNHWTLDDYNNNGWVYQGTDYFDDDYIISAIPSNTFNPSYLAYSDGGQNDRIIINGTGESYSIVDVIVIIKKLK